MLDAIVIDFETRSRVNLKTHGVDQYASDLSTDVLCMAAYDLLTDKEWLWYPKDGALPSDLVAAIEKAEFVAAVNARFDQLIWEYVAVEEYGFPVLEPHKWYCIAAQCRVNAVPSGLDKACLFITGKRGKLSTGGALIKELSIPNAEGAFNSNPTSLRKMGKYCVQDVRASVEVIRATRVMTAIEHREWHVSERINDLGFKIDRELAQLCSDQAAEEAADMAAALDDLTEGAVTAVTQLAKIKKWALELLPQPIIDEYLTRDIKDELKITFDKAARAALMAAVDDGTIEIHAVVLEVLLLLDAGNKSSVAKFKKMMELADPDDDRIRGAYMYAGASQTKRFAARGIQPQNLRRDCILPGDIPSAKDYLRAGTPELIVSGGSVMDTLSKLLRPTIMPENGNVFVICDWAAIEARVLPWLSDTSGGDKVLDIFDADEDIYLHTAARMNISSRQIGKVATLALGFQGGVNAFTAMGRAYGLDMTEKEVQEIVNKWREANSWAVDFWYKLDIAAKAALRYPRTWRKVGLLKYFFDPDMLGGTLVCQLPDKSIIQYPQARIESVKTPWGDIKPAVTFAKAGLFPKAGSNKWPRATLYSGLACENATQATAASLLRHALTECDEQNLPVALHVHDEIVLEVPISLAQTSATILQRIMETAPTWADGLPLKAVPSTVDRYSK